MFIIATRRSEFARVWESILKKRGETRQIGGLDDLRDFLRAQPIHLLILDLELPGSRDPATIRALVKKCGSGKLMLGGIRFAPNAELAGLALGAVACCDPALPVAECEKMVEVILSGGVWLSSTGMPALVEKLRNLAGMQNVVEVVQSQQVPQTHVTDGPGKINLNKLTKREREVAELVGTGANNKVIARKLLITDRTVKAHLTAIYDKLNISDRLQLALRVTGEAAAREALE